MRKRIKHFKADKVAVEKDDKRNQNTGVAYISTDDKATLTQLVKLHYHVSDTYPS